MPPSEAPALRWGVLGTGRMAETFVEATRVLPDQVVAVGSRGRQRAEDFGARHAVAHRHGRYEDLVADPDVDAVYIATPHSAHRSAALLALDAGKHVLCEKPFTLNAPEAQELVDRSRRRGLFLMEAMRPRFTPAMVAVRRLLAEGAVGEPRYLMADIGWALPADPSNRVYDPELGGGALLDVGVYAVSLASMLFGPPCSVDAIGSVSGGVDTQTSMLLDHAGGGVAVLSCTIECTAPPRATIVGTSGRLELPDWFNPTSIAVHGPDGTATVSRHPQLVNGMEYQLAEVGRCLDAGRTESLTMPLDESVAIMRTLDRIRARIGLRYPGE